MANHIVSAALLDKLAILDADTRADLPPGASFDDALLAMGPYLWVAAERDDEEQITRDDNESPLVVEDNFTDASSRQVKTAIKGVWQELADEGVPIDEFDRRYTQAREQRQNGHYGEDYRWVTALDLPERFDRHLEEVRKRTMIGSGKSFNVNGRLLREQLEGGS